MSKRKKLSRDKYQQQRTRAGIEREDERMAKSTQYRQRKERAAQQKQESQDIIQDIDDRNPPVSPDHFSILQRNPQDWVAGDRKALDLSDAEQVGFKGQERNDLRNLDDVIRLMDQFQTNLNRLLGRMQDILMEAVRHIETLENHWQRLK